jgi:hypothetical protein
MQANIWLRHGEAPGSKRIWCQSPEEPMQGVLRAKVGPAYEELDNGPILLLLTVRFFDDPRSFPWSKFLKIDAENYDFSWDLGEVYPAGSWAPGMYTACLSSVKPGLVVGTTWRITSDKEAPRPIAVGEPINGLYPTLLRSVEYRQPRRGRRRDIAPFLREWVKTGRTDQNSFRSFGEQDRGMSSSDQGGERTTRKRESCLSG